MPKITIEMMTDTAHKESQWYALRVTYSRELKVQEYLEAEGVQTFIPMHDAVVLRRGRRVKARLPIVHNLIFVYTTREILNAYKQASPIGSQVRYMMNKETHQPIVIPQKQMEDFMAVAGGEDSLFLDPEELRLKKGDRVRINSGAWQGIEGRFVRLKGGMRVVVEIQGIMAVATITLSPAMVDKLPAATV